MEYYGRVLTFINTKFAEKPQNYIKLTVLSYSSYTFIFYPLVIVIHLNALRNQLIKLKRINCINETVKFKLKLNYGLSLYMLSTN